MIHYNFLLRLYSRSIDKLHLAILATENFGYKLYCTTSGLEKVILVHEVSLYLKYT